MAKTTSTTPSSELREGIYQLLLQSGVAGLTDEQISKALKVTGDTLRPRRNELVTAERVVNSGERRPTKRGRTAIVWRAVKKARKPAVAVRATAAKKAAPKRTAKAAPKRTVCTRR